MRKFQYTEKKKINSFKKLGRENEREIKDIEKNEGLEGGEERRFKLH